MKRSTVQLVVLVASVILVSCHSVFAQSGTVREIDALERKSMTKLTYSSRFETLDTTDGSGKRTRLSRSYYLDTSGKFLSFISILEDQRSPGRGLQLYYTFSQNELVKLTAIPATRQCRRCKAEYYFLKDSLISKSELRFSISGLDSILKDSRKLTDNIVDPAWRKY